MSNGSSGRRILIVGGASGIGAAGAAALIADGWQVAMLDRDRDALAATTGELGIEVSGVVDASDDVALRREALRCLAELGGAQAIWSNAGVQTNGTAEEATLEEFDRCWSVNVRAHFVMAQVAVPHLRAGGGGSLLITASNSGLQTESRMVAYSTTKAAAIQLVRLLARDHARDGIRVNALCPGFVDTSFNTPVWETFGGRAQFLDTIGESIPLGRMSTPKEVAAHVRFLLSDDASFVTGHAFVADGGELVS